MKMLNRVAVSFAMFTGLGVLILCLTSGPAKVQEVAAATAATNTASAADSDLERARREVRLLDDIYKTSIVLITTHYVNDDEDLAAGSAFKALFEAVGKKGWHEVRLLDATGEPYNDENSPREGFEKRAIEKLLNGEATYDEVEYEDGRRYLRAATAIPVVMEKCIICHDNYRDVPQGRAIGAVGYRVPILTDADLKAQ